MSQHKGFTLIEILIALTVFAILASITSSVLYNSFAIRARVNEQTERLNELELAISIIQQETTQTIERAVRGNENRLFPSFIGQLHYLEFTRDGLINPASLAKRSNLKRVAYVCEEGQLIHRTWQSLDTLDRNQFKDKILINQLAECHFNYLNQNLQLLPDWHVQNTAENAHNESLPKAIQMNLTLKDWGEIKLFFIIPEALYAAKEKT